MAVGALSAQSSSAFPVVAGFWQARDSWASSWRLAIAGTSRESVLRGVERRWRGLAGQYLVYDRSNRAAGGGPVATSAAIGSGYKAAVQSSVEVCMAGVGTWLAKVDDAFRIAMIARLDARIGALAYQILRDWPVWSGFSRSQLDVEVGLVGADLVLRLRSRAPYTLIAPATREAWSAARKRWREIPGIVAADLDRLELEAMASMSSDQI